MALQDTYWLSCVDGCLVFLSTWEAGPAAAVPHAKFCTALGPQGRGHALSLLLASLSLLPWKYPMCMPITACLSRERIVL
jgi:hypothetical protein